MRKPDATPVHFTLNATAQTVEVAPRDTLAATIREACRVTSVRVACEDGSCGACTAIVDGEAVRTCMMLALQAEGREVRTVESLSAGDDLHPLQRAFEENFAVGCGYCTPGFLMLAVAALERNPNVGEEEIEEIAATNYCRCTGYRSIVRALKAGRQQMAALAPRPAAEREG